MRRVLTRVVVVALAVAGLSTLGHGSTAYADPKCDHVNPATGPCVLVVTVPGGPTPPTPTDDGGPTDTGSGASCYWDPAKQGLTKPPAGPVPCTSKDGYWSNTHNCYVQPMKPPPPAGDPSWEGHDPADGAVYWCFQPQTGMVVHFWSQDAPAGAGAGPSPRAVAEMAIKRMSLSAIQIGIVPKPGPDSVGIVGMPVWMWVEHPDGHTFGPMTASASAGGITVTATAKVHTITWDMGDGTKVVCHTAGTPYLPSYGGKDSPDCGHVYLKSSADQAGESYTVTATSDWVITWAGAGQTGTIRLGGLTRTTQITIGEAQVLVS